VVGELDAIGILEARKLARARWSEAEVVPVKAGRKLSKRKRHNLLRGAYIHAAQLRGVFEDNDDEEKA
jgi:hypothetical protein